MATATSHNGFVTIAGAGPGDEELITLKLLNRLREAEVVITDRLVNPAIIRQHCPAETEVILAGKRGYSDASQPQEAISALIVTHALQGKKVIRLKGGDVSFFSNVLDELQALRQHGIPFEIIPGVTAASGVSAYAGFPLTARGYAQGVQFIAFNPKNTLTEAQWKAIGETADTLVFYMATKNMALLAEALLRYGKKPDTALGLIEQATTRFQKVHLSSLQECKQDFENRSFSSPALVIVGDVVRLHREFSWYTGNEEGSVFEELPSR